jgi:hypothetical protein
MGIPGGVDFLYRILQPLKNCYSHFQSEYAHV